MSTQLPLDITEQIISTLWLSPLSPSHRATFIKSSHLVSKMWDAVFSRVAAQDVYILSDSHSWRFLDIFSGRGTSHLRHLLDHLCRSITFEHEHKSLFPCPEEDELGRAIYLVLRVISASPNRLPRLRRVALVVKDFLEETIFNDRPFLYMPSQVRELDINFWYGAETTSDTVFGIKLKTHIFERFHIPRGSLSFIRRLRVKGTSMAVVKLLLEACGGWERLSVFEQDIWKEKQPRGNAKALPSVYEDERFSDDEDTSEGEEEEEFYDCEEGI